MSKIIIVSAPSGSGKSTVVDALLKKVPNLVYSVSATTRKKRPDEVEGKDYYFISTDDFKKKLSDNAFVEHEEVYSGIFYGTLKSEIDTKLSQGKSIIFVLDVKGALNLTTQLKDSISIFIRPPSLNVLEKRLRDRGTEDQNDIQERLKKAEYELTFKDKFDFIVTNDHLNVTVDICQYLVS